MEFLKRYDWLLLTLLACLFVYLSLIQPLGSIEIGDKKMAPLSRILFLITLASATLIFLILLIKTLIHNFRHEVKIKVGRQSLQYLFGWSISIGFTILCFDAYWDNYGHFYLDKAIHDASSNIFKDKMACEYILKEDECDSVNILLKNVDPPCNGGSIYYMAYLSFASQVNKFAMEENIYFYYNHATHHNISFQLFDADSAEITDFRVETYRTDDDTTYYYERNKEGIHLILKESRYCRLILPDKKYGKYRLVINFDNNHKLFSDFKIVEGIHTEWAFDSDLFHKDDSIRIMIKNNGSKFFYLSYGPESPFLLRKYISFQNGEIQNIEMTNGWGCSTGAFFSALSRGATQNIYIWASDAKRLFPWQRGPKMLDKINRSAFINFFKKEYGDSIHIVYGIEAIPLRWSGYETQIVYSQPITITADDLFIVYQRYMEKLASEGESRIQILDIESL